MTVTPLAGPMKIAHHRDAARHIGGFHMKEWQKVETFEAVMYSVR